MDKSKVHKNVIEDDKNDIKEVFEEKMFLPFKDQAKKCQKLLNSIRAKK